MEHATLLLVPGLLNTPRAFDRVRALLPLALEVRVADLRTQESIDAMAREAWALLADLPRTRPLLLAGYSMGGYVVQRMLSPELEPPRAVQGLALLSTSARADTPEGAALRQRAIEAIERDFERYVGTLVTFMLDPERLQDKAFVAEVRADMLAVGAVAAQRQHRAAAARSDQREAARRLGLPVQVLGGGADKVTPPQLSEELAQLFANARLRIVPGAGHLMPFEHPAEVAAALVSLAERV